MPIELTTLLQHVSTLDSGQSQDKALFIDNQGGISEKSGLGLFQRLFSSSAKKTENRTTIEAFKQAIANSPQYGALLESKELTNFFQTKQQQGSALTAKDVQQVKLMLGMEKGMQVGRELVASKLIPSMDATSFAWYCVGKGLSLDSPEKVKVALQEYLAPHFESKAKEMLSTTGVKAENMDAALKLLKSCPSWTKALEGAFEGDLKELTQEVILSRLGSGLDKAATLLEDMGTKDILKTVASKGSQGVQMFEGALQGIQSGVLTQKDGTSFLAKCVMEDIDPSTPELLGIAINDYCLNVDAGKICIAIAVKNGLPEGVGKSLAFNPDFVALSNKAMLEAFKPPTLPTREELDKIIDKTATEFFTEKNDAIRELLTLAKKSSDFDPALKELAGEVTEKFICEMLNPLLAAPGLVDHLLNPEKGPDSALIKHLENFQTALIACQHTMESEFGGANLAEATERCLAIIMGAKGATGETLGTLMKGVQKNFSIIAPGLAAVNTALQGNKLKAAEVWRTLTGINNVQSILRRVAFFAHSTTTPTQKEALGIEKDLETFITMLEEGPNGKGLPLSDIHQSVRSYTLNLGVQIDQTGYQETQSLAETEATAFTGSVENPVVTDLLHERAGAIANEIGLTDFNPKDLDPVKLGALIQRKVQERRNELLSPAQAREVAEQAIREHLLALKPALEYINGLPTQQNVLHGLSQEQFAITPSEKQNLLRIIPSAHFRDPDMIKLALLEARAMKYNLEKLTVPGLPKNTMHEALMSIASNHAKMIAPFQDKEGAFDVQKIALTLALDEMQLDPGQTKALYEAVSGPMGLELGRSYVTIISNIQQSPPIMTKMLGGMKLLDHMRLILAPRTGEIAVENPIYYSDEMAMRDIPSVVLEEVDKTLNSTTNNFPGFAALSQLNPKLSKQEWDALMPIMHMAGQGFKDHYDQGLAVKMVASNARELLAALKANQGKPLSPEQVWQTVIGGKPPRGLKADNAGALMFKAAAQHLFERAKAMNPEASINLMPMIEFMLSQGIPFQNISRACQPGGRLSLEDYRFGPPSLSSLKGCNLGNAYGLVTDWARRQPSREGDPSTMTIEKGDGSGLVIAHKSLTEKENVPGNPIFLKIMEQCRSICKSDLQFMKVMQSLSQAGTINLRLLAESIPGMTLSEHGHFNSSVKPQPNGDVIVEFVNGEGEHPFGAHIQITVSPEGIAVVTDIGIELRG